MRVRIGEQYSHGENDPSRQMAQRTEDRHRKLLLARSPGVSLACRPCVLQIVLSIHLHRITVPAWRIDHIVKL